MLEAIFRTLSGVSFNVQFGHVPVYLNTTLPTPHSPKYEARVF
jgi:hypothetical protein